MMVIRRPPYDIELQAILPSVMESFVDRLPRSPDQIASFRADFQVIDVESTLGGREIGYTEFTVPTADGAEISMSVYRRLDHVGHGAGIYFIHGGGMIFGNHTWVYPDHLDWVIRHGLVVASIDYRLAPEHPDPVPVEDCYIGLLWLVGNSEAIGVDPKRILISGSSAGGGLAAGVSLLARDRSGPPLLGQLLMGPMLDDRDRTVSTRQFEMGPWNRHHNHVGWNALLGDRRRGDDVSIYAAPARATDLCDLPPAFIDVGSAEMFRDESVAYASAIWEAGGNAELHVWPGGFHSFELSAPLATLSTTTLETRAAWVRRILDL